MKMLIMTFSLFRQEQRPMTQKRLSKIAAFIIILALAGCSPKKDNAVTQPGIAGGLTWTTPTGWTEGATQQMRILTYVIKAANGDIDNAECAVFYFGRGQGGNKESNLTRWANQFEQADGRNSADLAVIKELEVNGLKVATIDVNGIYQMAGGPMMAVKDKKLGYRLLGAIVDGPNGLVFFKMVGPEKTIASSMDAFNAMINTVKSAGA
jgi:hypothetical protein